LNLKGEAAGLLPSPVWMALEGEERSGMRP
jgi:hypothetical protein